MAMVLEPWVFGLWGLGVYALRSNSSVGFRALGIQTKGFGGLDSCGGWKDPIVLDLVRAVHY